MDYFQTSCSCFSDGDSLYSNTISCAPCPPPFLTYSNFVGIAEDQNLTSCEIDTILSKCGRMQDLTLPPPDGDIKKDNAREEIVRASCNTMCIVSVSLTSFLFIVVITIIIYIKKCREAGKHERYDNSPSTKELISESGSLSNGAYGPPISIISVNERTNGAFYLHKPDSQNDVTENDQPLDSVNNAHIPNIANGQASTNNLQVPDTESGFIEEDSPEAD